MGDQMSEVSTHNHLVVSACGYSKQVELSRLPQDNEDEDVGAFGRRSLHSML